MEGKEREKEGRKENEREKKRTRKRKKRILTLNVEQVLEVENNHSVTTAGKTG